MRRTAAQVQRGPADGGARRPRGAATRVRILDAVVACIDEVGFARTSHPRIARRAGVSVGAVQHHFPAKADVLAAVLERSFTHLAAQFEGASVAGAPLEERVSVFVERAWRHYGSADFRSTLEILWNARDLAADGASGRAAPPIGASARRVTALWNSFFGDQDLPPSRQREIRQFTFAALSGLAMAQRLQPGAAGMQPQVALLCRALVALFEAEPRT